MTFENALEKKKKMLKETSSHYPIVCPSYEFDEVGCVNFLRDLIPLMLTDDCAKHYSNNGVFKVFEVPKQFYFRLI